MLQVSVYTKFKFVFESYCQFLNQGHNFMTECLAHFQTTAGHGYAFKKYHICTYTENHLNEFGVVAPKHLYFPINLFLVYAHAVN